MFTTVASRWKQRSSQVSDGVADGDKSKDIPRSWLCGKLVRDEPLVSVLPPAFNREAFVNNVGDPRPFKPTNGAGLLASPTPDRPHSAGAPLVPKSMPRTTQIRGWLARLVK